MSWLRNHIKFYHIIKYSLISSILLFLVSLPLRRLHIDDPWIAEYSYWIAKMGYLRSDLMQGFLNYSEKMYVYHKGHYLFGALAYKIFGFSMYVFKASSLFWMLLSFGLVYLYSKSKRNVFKDKASVLFVFLLLMVNHQFFEYGFVMRPEMMMLFFGFFSFFLLYKKINLTSAIKNSYFIPMAGLFAGLSGFTHLTGIIFCFTGFSFLLIKKEFKNSIFFGVFCLIGFVPYFYDITTIKDWNGFLWQIENDPVLKIVKGGGFGPLTKLIHEHQRYFVYPWMVSFSLLFIFTLSFDFRNIKKEQKDLLLISGLGALFLGIFAAKTAKYLIILTPFYTLLIAPSLLRMREMGKAKRNTLVVFLFLFFAINIGYNVGLITLAEDRPAMNTEVAKLIPKGSKILSSLPFVFNQIENYNIQAESAHTFWQLRYLKKEPSMESLLAFASQYQRQYVILDLTFTYGGLIKELKSWDYQTKHSHGNYQIIHHDAEFVIFKSVDRN